MNEKRDILLKNRNRFFRDEMNFLMTSGNLAIFSENGSEGDSVMKKNVAPLFLVFALFFVACSDDDNGFIARDSEESLLSSSDVAGETSRSSSSETSASSSSKEIATNSSSSTSAPLSSNNGNGGETSSSSSAKSSSSSVKSSSSVPSSSSVSSSSVESSSSVTPAEPCKTDETDTCEYGTLTDDRDGKTYKTVKIGEQWWMAENLNFRYLHPTKTMDSTSYCVDGSPENCEKYGRQYMWNAAMDSAGRFSTSGKGCGYRAHYINCINGRVRGVCPENWHLPSKAEFEILLAAAGGENSAAKVLKATSGWDDGSNGTDAFGFSALPAGDKYGEYRYEGDVAFFWSATAYDEYSAWHMNFMYGNSWANMSDFQKGHAFSVRCIKDPD